MANTTNSSQQSSRSDHEPSHMQESASSRPRSPTAPLAHTTTEAEAAARKLRKNLRASSPVKNANGKRPFDDEERMILEGGFASKHVAGNKKPAIDSKVAPAPSKIPSVASKAPAASKATAAAKIAPTKTPSAVIKAAAATKAAATKVTVASRAPAVKKAVPAATTAKPRAKAPAPGSRFQLTAKEDTIRQVKRTPEQLARENKELQERFAAADEKAKNFKVHPGLLKGGKKSANTPQTTKTGASKSEGATKAKAPAKKATNTSKAAQSAAKTNTNTAKALADKTNTSTKRRGADTDLHDVLSPQKRHTEGSQPARFAGKKTNRDKNAPAATHARPVRATQATKEAEKKAVAAPKRRVKKEVQSVFWKESSDGEESELELVTKEEYSGKGRKKVESEETTKVEAATAPVTKKAVAAGKTSTKRAHDDSDDDDDDAPPAPKTAKVAEPVKETSDGANAITAASLTGNNPSAATFNAEGTPPEPVVPRKKGVAQFTDPKVRKQHAAQAKRRVDGIAWRKEQADEREAARKSGHTVAKATDFFTM